MLPSRVERSRSPIRWVSALALLALMPKCFVCLAAYAGIGAALGWRLGGVEFCGATAAPTTATILWFAAVGVIAGILFLRRRKPRS